MTTSNTAPASVPEVKRPRRRPASRRARPLPVEQRREALIDATTQALRDQRRPLSTREIARAAGVAEGTIFRIFASKDELIDAVITKAFSPRASDRQIERIDRAQPLRDRLVDFVAIIQERLQNVFGLMEALGLTAPPTVECEPDAEVRRAERLLHTLDRLVGEDGEQLRVDTRQLLRYLRLLTFSGSHLRICDGDPMSPVEIVDVVLTGVLCADAEIRLTARGRDGVASSATPLVLTPTPEEISC